MISTVLLHEMTDKHLMTGPVGKSKFCFPKNLNVPCSKAKGNIKFKGKQNSLFPTGPVIKCFVILYFTTLK